MVIQETTMLSACTLGKDQHLVLSGQRSSQQFLVLVSTQFPVKGRSNISETMSACCRLCSRKCTMYRLSLCAQTTHRWLARIWSLAAKPLAGAGIRNLLANQPLVVPWARVMASLHWAAQCYCRITERLIETNDSNNGTLSPQAGFVVGLISITVVAKRTSHHADPSKEAAEADSVTCSVRGWLAFIEQVWLNVNMFSCPFGPWGWIPLSWSHLHSSPSWLSQLRRFEVGINKYILHLSTKYQTNSSTNSFRINDECCQLFTLSTAALRGHQWSVTNVTIWDIVLQMNFDLSPNLFVPILIVYPCLRWSQKVSCNAVFKSLWPSCFKYSLVVTVA